MRRRLVLGLVVALLAGCAEGPPHRPPAAAPAMSPAQVLAAVRRAPAIRTLPPGLTPSPAIAGDDIGFDSDKCEAGPAADRIDPCVFGDRASAVHVVLYGDSYAGMWLPALSAIAEQRHWRLRFYGKPGCFAASRVCDRFRAYVIGQIRALRPSLVVIASQNVRGLMSTLSTLRRSAQRLVVLGDTPVLTESAPDCLARHPSNVPLCSTSRRAATAPVWNDADEAAARATGAGYISVLPWLCSRVCTPVIGDVTVYRNRFYLTATYARLMTGVLADELDRVSAG